MKKIILILMLGIFLMSLASASIGTFKQGQTIDLPQSCSDCSFNNVTSVIAPDGTQIVGNVLMTKNGLNYNYTIGGTLTSQIGTYTVNGVGDPGGVSQVWVYHFDIGGGNLAFFIFAFALFFGLTIWGIKMQSPWISLIGCMGVAILGVYTALNGVGSDKNTLTTAISYITAAAGLGVGFMALRDITNL